MTAYVPIAVSRAGADMTAGLVTPGGTTGDTFPPGTQNFLRVKNTAGSALTVSVIDAGTVAGPSGTFAATLLLGTVAATTGDKLFGPFPASAFAATSDGQVHVIYSAATASVAVYNMAAS